MAMTKISVTIEAAALRRMDDLVSRGDFASRSHVVRKALAAWIARIDGDRLARECSSLDAAYEAGLADDDPPGADRS